MKKKNETMLIPLIEMENKKLDVKLIKKALLGKKGQSTSLGDNINLFMWSERFEEQNKSQVYKLYAEITIHLYKAKEKYERDIYVDVIIGQDGVFLRADVKAPYNEISDTTGKLKNFIEFCKICTFIPKYFKHYDDGDYYVSESEYREATWDQKNEYEEINGSDGNA